MKIKSKKGILFAALIIIVIIVLAFFFMPKKQAAKNIVPGVFGTVIETKAGMVMLVEKNGVTTLQGNLARNTPCVNWVTTISKTNPIAIDIADASTSQICVQTVATPQSVSEQIQDTTPASIYRVTVAGELVFSGPLPQAAAPEAPAEGKADQN